MKKALFFITAVIIAAFTSCTEDKPASITNFNVTITDAPGTYDALFLSIKEIQVLTSDGQYNLEVDPTPFDILQFRLGKDTLLASQDIPSGYLQEIRLILNETGNYVVVDGEPVNLVTPSGQSSGIKIKVQADLTQHLAYTLKLDFDAARSIVQTGNRKYILKPVIRAIPNAVTGAITGIINPASSNASILAITGTDTLGTLADSTGRFYFPGIMAGTYKIEITPVLPYSPQVFENVSVENGSVKDLGTITLSE